MSITWQHCFSIPVHSFKCGFCDREVASEKGLLSNFKGAFVAICPSCSKPSLFWGDGQTPSPSYGSNVNHLPDDICGLYQEARNCLTVSSYTAAVLACRKMLMHIAVDQKADEGKSFLFYVEYLAEKGFVPPHGKHWVDHIRQSGNEANHEIVLKSRQEAYELITFIEMLLKFIYEFPKMVPQPAPGS